MIACGPRPDPSLSREWIGQETVGCVLASPLQWGDEVIELSGDGTVIALDADDGRTVWTLSLPHPDGEMAHVIATPVIVGDRMMVVWQNAIVAPGADPAAAPRSSHRAVMIDLATHTIDPSFPELSFAASKPGNGGTVVFQANNALSRSRLIHVDHGELGLVYVSFGNARDIQPWHGWVFEIDLDAWHSGAEPIRSTLLTTPEADCGPAGVSGSDQMICGGGVWSPAGPELIESASGYELVIPTGNGQLDLARHDYAHTLMRVRGPGLVFDDGCDPTLCAGFDVTAPSDACLSSCENLFIPRLPAGTPFFDLTECAGLSFFECYAALDWDLGANSPAPVDIPGGPRALVLPAKDGGLYLADAEHLGTLYDRLTLAEPCGSDGATCEALWAGMMVTRPEIALVDGAPIAIVAMFEPDSVHRAGVAGVRVEMRDGAPRLSLAWQVADDLASFRRHPSRVRLIDLRGEPHAVVVDQGRAGQRNGVLYVIRARDGEIVSRVELAGPGQRFAQPLSIGDRVYVPSCTDGNRGPGHVEAWRVR
jgi:hypothetical protein